MTAALQIAASILSIPLDLIDASPTNPRKTFTDVDELAADFKLRGVLVPLIVRAAGKRYECVDGERRLRAAKIAKLATVPGQVRELSDLEVLEIQIVSQAKRADIHPVEEAEAYRMLRDVHHLSVEEIAAKVGRPKGTVYERLKLCELAPEVRKAALAGELPASHAVLIARIPDKKLQVEAFEKVVKGSWTDGVPAPMSFERTREFVSQHYHLALGDAPWDLKDATLVPAAGACSACPKRTGNQPELFADVKAKDTCTDPACFESKKKAYVALRMKKAEAEGNALRSAVEAEKSLKSGNFVDLDQEGYIDGERTTLRKKLGKRAERVQTAIAPTRDGLAVKELASKEEVDKLLGREKQETKRRDEVAERQREIDKARKADELRAAVNVAIIAEAVKKVEAKDFGRLMLITMAEALIADRESIGDVIQGVERRYATRGKPDPSDTQNAYEAALDQLKGDIHKMKENELRGLVFELGLVESSLFAWERDRKGPIKDALSILGVDEKKIAERVKEELKAAAKALEKGVVDDEGEVRQVVKKKTAKSKKGKKK